MNIDKSKTLYIAVFPEMGPLVKGINPGIHLFYNALIPYGVEILDKAVFDIKYFFENRNKIKIVHIQWISCFIRRGSLWIKFKALYRFIITLVYLKMLRIKIIYTNHNFPPFHEHRALIDYLYVISLVNLANLVICHSETSRRELSRFTLIRNKLCVMPLGSYTGFYKNEIKKTDARKSLNIPEDMFVYLFFGLIRQYKGVDELIEAFLQLDNGQGMLYIIGDSLHDGYVGKCIIPKINKAANIKLINSLIDDDTLQIYFNACDAIVYPLRRVTSSGSIMLAYTFAKPVVIRDCGLARELFDEKVAVYFSDKNDLVSALKKVKQLDPNTVENILKNKDKEFKWCEVIKRIAHKYVGLQERK